MQERDWSHVSEVEDYLSIPPGEYRCKIGEVRVGVTRDGSERWALRLEVVEGDFSGRTAGWDGLNWSERGLPRIKYVLARLGFDTNGRLALAPEDLVNRQVVATLQQEEREDPITGRRTIRLRVPYLGYASAENGSRPPF